MYNSKTYNNGTFQLLDSSYQNLYMYTKIADKYMHLNTLSSGAKNENPVGPPEYIKITGNVNNYKFRLPYDSDSNAFLAEVDFYDGETKVEYKMGNQGCFTFY